jgi:hypothetical protein
MHKVFFVLCGVFFSLAHAQDWPARAVRIVVPFPPGGAADALPRVLADKLAARLGQPFVVENRAGASGTIGAELLSRSEPDGYTFVSTPPAPLVINPYLYTKLPYDPWQFVPVGVIAAIPSVLLVHPTLPVNDLAEFVGHIRQNPGKLNYASQGATTVSFLTTGMVPGGGARRGGKTSGAARALQGHRPRACRDTRGRGAVLLRQPRHLAASHPFRAAEGPRGGGRAASSGRTRRAGDE